MNPWLCFGRFVPLCVRPAWPFKPNSPGENALLPSPPCLLFPLWPYVLNPCLCAWVKRREQYWELCSLLYGQAKPWALWSRGREMTSCLFSLYKQSILMWEVQKLFLCCSPLCNHVEQDHCVCSQIRLCHGRCLVVSFPLWVYYELWLAQLRSSKEKGEFLHLLTVKKAMFFGFVFLFVWFRVFVWFGLV